MYTDRLSLETLKQAREQTSGGVLEVRQSQVDGCFPASRDDLCPVSHWYTAAVICLTAMHMHAIMRTCNITETDCAKSL